MSSMMVKVFLNNGNFAIIELPLKIFQIEG